MEIKGRTISEVWEKSIQQIIKDDSPLVPTPTWYNGKRITECNNDR
jgi:hypothetical protein